MENITIGKPFEAQGKKVYVAHVKLSPSSEKYIFNLDSEERVSMYKNMEWGVTEDKTLKDILDMVKGNDNIEQLLIRLI